MDASDLTRLAIAQGIYKAVAGEVKTGLDDNIRGRADNELRDLYSEAGATSVDLKIGMTRVGKLSLKAVPAHAVVTDPDDLDGWVMDNLPSCVHTQLDVDLIPPGDLDILMTEHPEWCRYVVDEREALRSVTCVGGRAVDAITGEIVPGVAWVPDGVGSTVVTGCTPDAVADALRTNMLSLDAAIGMLEGGD